MNLFEETKPLKIIHPIGGERVIAVLFPSPDGLYFFDIGWDEPLNVTHPIHFVEGEIKGGGPWTVGDSKIEIIQKDDPLMVDLNRWNSHPHPDNKQAFEILLQAFPDEAETIVKWYEDNDITIQ